ncbi:hypothetical protein PIB30_066306 [Stylosanthes scabra]|uniref:Uncharacterized protein n=1 Tax=Stylosanthes scabra TaxID=79078 RepID=A0ABU6TM10_9FABA|nr:hypothetical protein [Stylosanthes scabra]
MVRNSWADRFARIATLREDQDSYGVKHQNTSTSPNPPKTGHHNALMAPHGIKKPPAKKTSVIRTQPWDQYDTKHQHQSNKEGGNAAQFSERSYISGRHQNLTNDVSS